MENILLRKKIAHCHANFAVMMKEMLYTVKQKQAISRVSYFNGCQQFGCDLFLDHQETLVS